MGMYTCVFALKKELSGETEQDLKSGSAQESLVRAEVGREPRGVKSCQPNYLGFS